MNMEQIVKRNITVNTSKDHVWKALTEPEQTKKYMFNAEVYSDWKVGSPIKWKGEYEGYVSAEQGIILQCEWQKCLKYTSFDPNFGLEDIPENHLHISYELIDKGQQTEVLINVINFNGDSKRTEGIAKHWDSLVLPKFKKLFQNEETINYKVKQLNADNAACFVEYFESLDFSHAPLWSTCFCRYYHTTCTEREWKNRTGLENRSEALKEIKAGNMKGYLAFDGDKCIGWCNANDARQFIRLENDIKHIIKDKKVGCVICFTIHPEYRGKGVARLLLDEAVEGFKQAGFDAVMAIPIVAKDSSEKLYRGTINMYKEKGFKEIEKDADMSFMLLSINDKL